MSTSSQVNFIEVRERDSREEPTWHYGMQKATDRESGTEPSWSSCFMVVVEIDTAGPSVLANAKAYCSSWSVSPAWVS
jgi:hypothetical protein